MKAVLLGIDGLSYTSFMKCSPRFLFTLFSSTFRGVVSNKRPQFPYSSWLSILEMQDVNQNGFLPVGSVINTKLLSETGAIPINLPITDPTFGKYSIKYSSDVDFEEEINSVVKAILENVKEAPVIADITAIDRVLHHNRDPNLKCKIYQAVDHAVKRIVSEVDDFIIFSPYGEPLSEEEGNHEDYGVYLSTMPRPKEHDVVKLPEIGKLFLQLVKGY
ncbi:MAG: hypothetical protein OWQ54_08450 [Sulfolobaceae archaeon]|nr:hypothetical protein [Sulfolobaceae archaeon]